MNSLHAKSRLTPAEAAACLGVAPVTVRTWARKGWLRADITAGGHRRFTRAELLRFSEEKGLTLRWPGDDRMKILVVDDNQPLTAYLTELFATLPTPPQVQVAYDGFEAGATLMSFMPDILLLDLMMPGMDGFSVCERVKADPAVRGIRIVAMTGYPSHDNTQRILAAGAETCLHKPLDKTLLLNSMGLQQRRA